MTAVANSVHRFILLTNLGTALWTGALASAGHALGEQYGAIERYLGQASNAVVGAILLWYLYRVATFRRGTQQ